MMKPVIAVLLLSAVAAAAQDRGQGVRAAADSAGLSNYDPARNHALVIGIDAYAHWRPLRCAVNDARKVAAVLRDDFGFGDVQVLTDGQATREQIMSVFYGYLDLGEQDNLLVYYAGHGWKDDKTGSYYWIPVDAHRDRIADYLANSQMMGDYFRQYRVKHLLIVSDSCFGGAMMRNEAAQRPPEWKLPDGFRKPSRWILTSGDLAPVPDDAGGGNSPFATRLTQYMQCGDAAVFGVLDLFTYLRKNLADPEPNADHLNIPAHMPGGEFVFVRQRTRVIVPPAGVGSAPTTPAAPVVETLKGSLRVDCLSAGTLMVGGARYAAQAGNAYTFELPVGRQTVRLEDDGRTWQEEADVRADSIARLTARLTPAAPKGMVFVEGGTFQMGSGTGESDEKPVHTVTVSGFFMGTCEVTVGEFRGFTDETGYKTTAEQQGWAWAWDGKTWGKVNGANWRNPGFQQTDRHPVVCVSWDDAIAYCEWMTRKTGKTHRLPTEAEWEYACRAGTTTVYQWGDDPDGGNGWCNAADLTGREKIPFTTVFNWPDGHIFTAPVGAFKANAFGLFDMHGNVWEWCQDWYGDYSSGTATDPTGPSSGSRRVLRGGSWSDFPACCRSAFRSFVAPAYPSGSGGFRVVCVR